MSAALTLVKDLNQFLEKVGLNLLTPTAEGGVTLRMKRLLLSLPFDGGTYPSLGDSVTWGASLVGALPLVLNEPLANCD